MVKTLEIAVYALAIGGIWWYNLFGNNNNNNNMKARNQEVVAA
jgi:hypothetical protein